MKILDIVRVKATGQVGYIICANEDRWDVQFPTEYKYDNETYLDEMVANQGSYIPEELIVEFPA